MAQYNLIAFPTSLMLYRRTTRRRMGAMYVSVLLTSLIVSVTTLAGLKMLELRVTSQAGGNDALRARQVSDSGLALALARLNQQTDWRSRYKSGTATNAEAFDGGTFWYILENAQGDLTQLGDGSVTLTVHSRYGQAGHARTATLNTNYNPLPQLDASVYVHGNLSIGNNASLSTDGSVWVNGSITSGADAIQASSVRSANGSGGSQLGTLLGNVAQPVAQIGGLLGIEEAEKTLLDTQWIEEYIAIGTEIPYSSLSSGRIDRVVISPNHNPYGPATNARGIYFIQCKGARVRIQDSRIEGTLVLLDCASNSDVEGNVHWTAATVGMPALVVRGSFNIKFNPASLNELLQLRNFNPPHTPFRGRSDGDIFDVYPSRIFGPVLVTGSLSVNASDTSFIHGGIYVLGNMTLTRRLFVQRDDALKTSPPPGLRSYKNMSFTNGTIRSVATVW